MLQSCDARMLYSIITLSLGMKTVTMKRSTKPANGRESLVQLLRWGFLVVLFGVIVTLFFRIDSVENEYYFSAQQSTAITDLNQYSSSRISQEKVCLVEPVKSPVVSQTTRTAPLPPAQNSSSATVMAMATGYDLNDYQRFVGSLRKTGYQGHIFLAVSPDLSPEIEQYLLSRNVDIRKVQYINCSNPVLLSQPTDEHERELVTCLHPYPTLKHRWARFPLLRDFLQDCTSCTGPVLITDMRDTVFQRDPFGPEAPVVPFNTLQVFQEHYTMRTTDWLVDWPVFDCKGIKFNEPMLCSGTTIGTRSATLEYLRIMHAEMDEWMNDPKCCCFKTNGDDQSIHNYLFYSGKLDHIAVAIPNRIGLVNTVGVIASLIFQQHINVKKKELEAAGKNPDDAHSEPFVSAGEKNWLGLHYGLTDQEGYLVNYNGDRSFVVHQFDRFGWNYDIWLQQNKEQLLDY
jgi:hypothetical protein